MSEITNKVVKGSRKLVNKASSRSKKLAKNLTDGTQQFIDGTLKSTDKIAKDISNNSKNIYKQFEKGNITEGIKGTGNLVSSSFGKIVDNQYLNIILKVIIAVYTAFTIPHISKGFAYFFDNLIVKILFALLIVFVSSKDPSLSILIALSYILTLQQANKYRLIERSQRVQPTFNNEYFNYDEETSQETSTESSQENNAVNIGENLKHHSDILQNDFNEKPDSLNQNYERVHNTQEDIQQHIIPEENHIEPPKHISQVNQLDTKDQLRFGAGNNSTIDHNLEHNQEHNQEHQQESNVHNQYQPHPILSQTHNFEQVGGISDENNHGKEPLPIESSGEYNYQELDRAAFTRNITTPENETIDFSTRLLEDCSPPSDENIGKNISNIQGFEEDAPAPYSAGDLGFSTL